MRIVTDAKLQRPCDPPAACSQGRPEGYRLLAVHRHARVPRLGAARRARARAQRVEDRAARADYRRGHIVSKEEVLTSSGASPSSAATEERDAVIHAFAPFYRLGPRPARPRRRRSNRNSSMRCGSTAGRRRLLFTDVPFATDVLAEGGVNLQDAALPHQLRRSLEPGAHDLQRVPHRPPVEPGYRRGDDLPRP